jgi:hypothetical protein
MRSGGSQDLRGTHSAASRPCSGLRRGACTPTQSVALSYVSKAGAAAHLGAMLFKGVVVAHDVFFCGMGDTKCLAWIAKMLLIGRLFSELGLLPFDGEGCEVRQHVLALF